MDQNVIAKPEDYAVASFQLNRAIIFMLAEKGILNRREIVDKLETFAAVSEKMPSGARSLYDGVVNGIKQNLPK